jgi:hypothetical protein
MVAVVAIVRTPVVNWLGQQPHGRARGHADDRATLDGISGQDERENDHPELHRTPNPIRRRGGSGRTGGSIISMTR